MLDIDNINVEKLKLKLNPKRYKSTLLFSLINNKLIPDSDILSIEELVLKCLVLTHSYPSYNSRSLSMETSRNKFRSVRDIWRHVKFYRDVSILDVMAAMYTLGMGKNIYSHYCYDVRKRVFMTIVTNCFVYNKNDLDEYGLVFSDWEDINKFENELLERKDN